LASQVQELQQQRDSASNELASVKEEVAALKNRPSEVLKLRGEVGTLRDQKAQLGATTALSKMTATPEVRQLLHDQQEAGMGSIYKQLADKMKLTPEQTKKFNNLLADHVLRDVDDITVALRDKTPDDQLSRVFAGENASLEQDIQGLLGADGLAQYQDYTKNLMANLTALQFADSLTGSDAEKKAKSEKIREALQQESQSTLANAGLPPDFQTVPVLNFINIADEQQASQNLKLLEGIYQRVTANAGSYLSPDEITAFQAFANKAIANNLAALKMNRTLMAPISSE
jgi:hypothetical protein